MRNSSIERRVRGNKKTQADGRRRRDAVGDLVRALVQSVGSSAPASLRTSGRWSRSSPSQSSGIRIGRFAHSSSPLTSGLYRGVVRMSWAPFAHSGFALIHAVVLQPFSHRVQSVDRFRGCPSRRDLNYDSPAS